MRLLRMIELDIIAWNSREFDGRYTASVFPVLPHKVMSGGQQFVWMGSIFWFKTVDIIKNITVS